jgi:hypothetical protein
MLIEMDHLGLFGFEVCQTISGGPLELVGDLGQNFGETMRTLATAKHLGSEALMLGMMRNHGFFSGVSWGFHHYPPAKPKSTILLRVLVCNNLHLQPALPAGFRPIE